MKITRTPRYISANTSDNTLEFTIDFMYYITDEINAAFNPNLSDSELDTVIEEDAEDDYYSFIDSIYLNLKMKGFEVLEGPDYSDRKDSKSCYFVLCKGDEYEKLTVKFILNLRISDHRLSRHKGNNKNWDRFEAREDYYARELENYRELNEENPDDLSYDNLEIIVSGQKFHTFRQALSHVLNRVKLAFRDK